MFHPSLQILEGGGERNCYKSLDPSSLLPPPAPLLSVSPALAPSSHHRWHLCKAFKMLIANRCLYEHLQAASFLCPFSRCLILFPSARKRCFWRNLGSSADLEQKEKALTRCPVQFSESPWMPRSKVTGSD